MKNRMLHIFFTVFFCLNGWALTAQAPTITAPTEGQVLDNGCTGGVNDVIWSFAWTTVANATGYELSVYLPDFGNFPLGNPQTVNPNYELILSGVSPQVNIACKVRAKFADATVSDWSAVVNFTIEPPNADCLPTAAVISANAATTFCSGNSITLSGNVDGVWNTGATTPSIVVTTSGTYSVTNTNAYGSVMSNDIIVTVNPSPDCTITGNTVLCSGNSTQLCLPITSPTVVWSTGAITTCITVNTAGNYSAVVTALNGCASMCNQTVTVCQPATITSAQNGQWNQTTTWVNGVVPTAIDAVIIAHTIGNTNATSYCNNLTINANATLNQSGRLIIGGDVVVNGTFSHNPFNDFTGTSTEIGARRVAAPFSPPANSTDPAGKQLVTVSGTLNIGGGTFDAGIALAGRIVFNAGSTFNMSYGSNSYLTLTGWSDPNDATPQYLMDIDNLTTVSWNNSQSSIIVTHSNGTKPVISTGKNFIESTCNFYNPTLTNVGFTLLDNTTQYFGGASQRQMNAIVMGANTTLNLTNTTLRLLSARSGGGNVYSAGGRFSSLTAGNGTTLYGDYTLVDNCNTGFPVLFSSVGNLSFDNMLTLNVNVTKEAILNIPNGVTQNLLGTFNLQSGKVIVQGGTLDLRNATAITGFSPTRYFETRRGENYYIPNAIYTNLGSVLLPVTVSNTTPVTFSLGVTIPNGGSPVSVYAPISVLAPSSSNSSPSNVSVSLEPLVVPQGFVAPAVKWEITPSGSPTLSVTFQWTAASESYSFSFNREHAKVFHYNSGTMLWEELNSGLVTGPDVNGLYSLTATGVTQFSPFAVMVSNSVLKAELLSFTTKIKNDKALLNWQTANEVNVKNFTIEKSLDGKVFDKIAEIKANNTPSVYQAFDDDFSISSYYRLKINDLDGSSRLSEIIYLEKNNDKGIKISRHTEGSLFVETDDRIELITVTNTIGQVVKTTKDKLFLINDLNAGIYIVSVKTDKGFLSQKVSKE